MRPSTVENEKTIWQKSKQREAPPARANSKLSGGAGEGVVVKRAGGPSENKKKTRVSERPRQTQTGYAGAEGWRQN